MKRLSKEYCLNINEYIDVKFGSVNRINPTVVYITCKTWVCPQTDINYNEAMSEIFSDFKRKLKRKILESPYFENKMICDFDIKTASIGKNKKKYISFEFFVKQKGIVYQLNDLKEIIEQNFKTIIDDLVMNLKSHTFNVTKGK